MTGRLLFLLCALSLASFAKTIDIPVNLFGNGVSFDEIDIFVENAGMQFEANTPVAFDAASAFSQWSFTIDAGTYAVGKGPQTIGSTLTLGLSDTTSSGLNDSVTVRVYLLRGGKIVGAYDVTVAASGFIVTPVSTNVTALQQSQQQALTIAGVTPTLSDRKSVV